jgi:hypothetical protein
MAKSSPKANYLEELITNYIKNSKIPGDNLKNISLTTDAAKW